MSVVVVEGKSTQAKRANQAAFIQLVLAKSGLRVRDSFVLSVRGNVFVTNFDGLVIGCMKDNFLKVATQFAACVEVYMYKAYSLSRRSKFKISTNINSLLTKVYQMLTEGDRSLSTVAKS